MEKIKYYIGKYKIIILSFIIFALLVGLIFGTMNKKTEKVEKDDTIILENTISESVAEKQNIKVDIKGMVENPGVYELEENDRIIDVIEMAGGLKKDANTEYINLSKKLVDEMIIIIYSNDEVEKFKETEKEIIYIEYECICPDNINNACITVEDKVNTNGVKEEKNIENKDDNLISINSATIEELMTLSGIGESKAKAIIAYREENGGFKTLEEIMNVSGIGESAYSKIKDYIKL